MAIRVKRRRRLVLLLVCIVAIIVSLTGIYLFRQHQIQAKILMRRQDGMAAFQSGNYIAALNSLGRYLQEYPNDAEATYHYAQARIKTIEPGGEHLTQAIGVLQKLLDLQPDHATARQELLDAYLKAGFRSEALHAAEYILKKDPKNAKALQAKLEALLGLREFDKVLSYADTLLETDSQNKPLHEEEVRTDAIRSKAMSLISLHRFAESLPYLQEYNKAAPLDLDVQLRTLQVLRELRRSTSEIISHTQALKDEHPDDMQFDLLLAVAYRLANDRENSVRLLRAVAASLPTNENVVKRLATELDAIDLFSESTAVLHAAASEIESLSLQRGLAHRLIQNGRSQDVIDLLDQSKYGPTRALSDSELMGIYVLALSQLGRHKEMEPIIDALASRHNDLIAEAWVMFHRVVTDQEKQESVHVVEVCKNALSRHPRNPFFYYFMGQAFATLGEMELAMDAWRNASQLAPAWSMPLLNIARALLNTEHRVHAVKVAEAALKRSPNNLDIAVAFAVSATANLELISKDRIPSLIDLMEKIQEASPGEEKSLPLYVYLLSHVGRQDDAMELIKTVLGAETLPSSNTLLSLVEISKKSQLGLEDVLLKVYQDTYGVTPRLAYQQAIEMLNQGRIKEGRSLIVAALENSSESEKVAWQLVMARYLDIANEPDSLQVWMQLGEDQSNEINVQRSIISSRSAWYDRAFIDNTINRLRHLTNDQAVAWRVARSKWLLITGPRDELGLAKAIDMLTDVIGIAPILVEPRLL